MPDDDTVTSPGGDPYALALGEGAPNGGRLLYVGSIQDGVFSVLTLDDTLTPKVNSAVVLASGLHSIVEGPVVDGRRRVYVSNRYSPLIHVVDVDCSEAGQACELVVQSAIGISQVTSSGDYYRGLAISKDKRTLYAAHRSPASLAVFDVAEDGTVTERGLLALQGAPANVALLSREPGQSDLVYITDYSGDSLYCVDPETMNVVDHIYVGDGPYGIAILKDVTRTLQRAYVTNFEEDSLSVVDLDPDSPTWHQEIARIK